MSCISEIKVKEREIPKLQNIDQKYLKGLIILNKDLTKINKWAKLWENLAQHRRCAHGNQVQREEDQEHEHYQIKPLKFEEISSWVEKYGK